MRNNNDAIMLFLFITLSFLSYLYNIVDLKAFSTYILESYVDVDREYIYILFSLYVSKNDWGKFIKLILTQQERLSHQKFHNILIYNIFIGI